MTDDTATPDVLIAGAGLSASLTALCLAARRPGLRILLLDRRAEPGRDHTWSFHDPDVTPESRVWLAPAIAHHWAGQEVRFPAHRRSLPTGYNTVTPGALRDAVAAQPDITVRRAEVAAAAADALHLSDGTTLRAPLILDARGQRKSPHLALGWQKFTGLELQVPDGHGLRHPVIMDATVAQRDGYRFVYCLPFGPDGLLVEDTRYSDHATLDAASCAADAMAYAQEQGWAGATELRRESGVLPIALALDARALWSAQAGGAVPIGLSAALFHPVTGYSLPMAVRAAEVIAASPRLDTADVMTRLRDFALERAREQSFLRLLNRMLFRGCPPDERYRLLERFYRLPVPVIERFYADRLTWADRLRIVTGRPPIPLHRAAACLAERPLLSETRE
ncbi:lycopene beta-cyclase CrtY [Halodurantibacterium flavum]|uniref:Lycopene beta-cyclase CrtY n=1 Tax=Halodurantibacterium flavum TaxID=1382802 RepID=A0ABW4S3M8_9RHOB